MTSDHATARRVLKHGLIANSDERAREIVKEMVETDGSTLGYEIVTIVNLDAPAPESSPAQ